MKWRGVDSVYAAGQTIVFVIYTAVYFLDREPTLLASPAVRAAGLAIAVAGLALMAAGMFSLRAVIQIAPQPREGARLVTAGVYGWFRHPIYTAIVFIVLGLFLRKPTPGVGAAGAFVAVFLAVKTRYEERLLAAQYPGYEDYKRRSFGLFPIVRG